jgi:hypothetical protein
MNELLASNFNMRRSLSPVHKSAPEKEAQGFAYGAQEREYTQHLVSSPLGGRGMEPDQRAGSREGETVVR